MRGLHASQQKDGRNTNLLLPGCMQLDDLMDWEGKRDKVNDAVGDGISQEVEDGVDAFCRG